MEVNDYRDVEVVERIEYANKVVQPEVSASIKRPLTIPSSTFDYLTVLSMPPDFL